MLSGDPLHYVFPVTPPEGEKTLSVLTLPEREKTPCVQSPPEREKTPCVQSPPEGEKTPCVLSLPEREKTLCVQDISNQVQFNSVQEKLQNLPVGGRLRQFLPEWERLGSHRLITGLIRDGYKLPFRERPNLSRVPCIVSSYAGFDKQNALWTSIQDLLQKGAIEVVHTPDSLGFYSRLFLVPKPGNRWRPVIDLSTLNKFLAIPKFQDGDPRVHPRLPQKRGVGHIYRPHQRLPTCTYPHPEIPQVSFPRCHLPVHQPTFRASNSPPHFHQYSQGSKTDSLTIRNQAPPVPGRLVNQRPLKTNMHGSDSKTTKAGEGFGLYSQPQEVRPHSFPEVRLPRIPFFTGFGSCEAHARQVDKTSGDVSSSLLEVCYQCKDSYVHHWLTCIDGEDCTIGQDAYETFSVASQNSLEISNASGHTDPLESENDTTRGMVVRPSKCATRRISPPQGTQKTYLYRRLKRRLGRSLRSKFYRRSLVSHREASSHQPIRTEGGSSGSAFLPNRLQKQSSPYRLRQHLGGGLHQQTGQHKISRTLCSNVENPHLVSPKQCHTQSETHTGFTQCNSRRPLKEEPDPTNRVVPISTDLQTNFQTLGESPSGPVRNQPEQKTSYICLSDSGSSGLGSRCPQHPMGKPGCLRFSSHCPTAQGCTKISISNVQDDSDCPRLADKTMVLGPGGIVSGHPETTPTHTHSAQTTTEQPLPCQPNIPEPPCLVSRSSALQEHGFSAEVAERIAAPQRLSTRSIYASKWTAFQRWCTDKQVDFRNPSIGDICNFFWYLFNDLNRCPSTIEGYRTAIADTLGNTKQNISTNTEIARLIASFHRDKPKNSRPIPKWNLSLVLQRLTQPPFEPQEEAGLKFITWKTVFLLALASRKMRSEIHAWTLDGLLCLGD